MSFPVMTPFKVTSLGDISISLARGHYHFASTGLSEKQKAPRTVDSRRLYADFFATAVIPYLPATFWTFGGTGMMTYGL